MSIEEPLGKNLGCSIVKIYVGSTNTEFIVHQNIICSATEYFTKAFTGAFKERNGTIHLPEECPEAFSLFVDWLYRRRILLIAKQAHLNTLVKLYVFSEKICLTHLSNKVMDGIRIMCGKYKEAQVTTAMVGYVFKNTFLDSPLRTWALRDWVNHLDPTLNSGIPDAATTKDFAKLCTENEDFLEAYFCYMRTAANGKFPITRSYAAKCMYHRHPLKSMCYIGKAEWVVKPAWDSE
ncbi:uncharacterized protein BP5553_06273 [Venustampulla echinocandica]|uniref:BTB domain-containing protein n=1 Tax=Venustampulla echinocandica TaxID=2656787 RepID=A0A370TN27_9HELO|nr:uncharacterized protein BP5553_06273 [Venustampulla echinocandica]RDL36921.1 hypothetical protein BP5553_06273 [Venustampulla echinocandica]